VPLYPVFLLDPDDPGKTGKPGEVIRGSGLRKSPSRVQGQSPWWGVRGQSPPKPGSGGRAPRSWTGFNDYKDIFGWNFCS